MEKLVDLSIYHLITTVKFSGLEPGLNPRTCLNLAKPDYFLYSEEPFSNPPMIIRWVDLFLIIIIFIILMTKYGDIKQTCLSSKPRFLLLNSEEFPVNNSKQEVSDIDFKFLVYCSAHSRMSKSAISILIIPNLPHLSVLIPLSFSSSFFPPFLPYVLVSSLPRCRPLCGRGPRCANEREGVWRQLRLRPGCLETPQHGEWGADRRLLCGSVSLRPGNWVGTVRMLWCHHIYMKLRSSHSSFSLF